MQRMIRIEISAIRQCRKFNAASTFEPIGGIKHGAVLAHALGMRVIHTPLAHAVIDRAIRVHRRIGPGLFESVYQACLTYELGKGGFEIAQQVPVPLIYDELHFACAFRVDLIVNGTLMIELKSVERVLPVHHAQTLTYLRLAGLQQALLINFNVPRLTMGLKSYLGKPVPHVDAV